MQLAFFSVIAIAILIAPILPCWILWKQIQNQNQTIQTLTNLATSKDLATFQNLQVTTNQSNPSVDLEPIHPMNDAAIAHRMAENYKLAGFDPNLAYNQDEPNFADEFGLNM
jgi:hypothetical protein